METLGTRIACVHSAIGLPQAAAAQSPRRLAERSSSGNQKKQGSFSVRALQRARSTYFPAVPPYSPNSPINEQDGLLGSSASRIEQLPSERSSLSRSDVELMRELLMRKMVRADKEPSEKDTEDEADETKDSDRQLWMNRTRNMQTNAQIFSSMMFWIVLFFMSSIMDGENRGWREPRNRRSDRGGLK